MGRTKHEPEYKRVRPLVLERDNHCCIKCGSVLGLEVHHIEGYQNSKVDALATLCYLCHNIAPMGKDEFAQWLLIGESGIETFERKLSQNGVNKISRDTLWKVLTVLTSLGVETNKLRMKAARDRVKSSGMRCEGRKRYGERPAEKPILARIIKIRTAGISCDKIAKQLNEEGISSRCGKKWIGCTIQRILWREIPEVERGLRKVK